MSDDVLRTIDESIAANAARFDPFGPPPEARKSSTEEKPAVPVTFDELLVSSRQQLADAMRHIRATVPLTDVRWTWSSTNAGDPFPPPVEAALLPECADRHLNAVTDRWVLCTVRSSEPHRHTDGMSTWEVSNPVDVDWMLAANPSMGIPVAPSVLRNSFEGGDTIPIAPPQPPRRSWWRRLLGGGR